MQKRCEEIFHPCQTFSGYYQLEERQIKRFPSVGANHQRICVNEKSKVHTVSEGTEKLEVGAGEKKDITPPPSCKPPPFLLPLEVPPPILSLPPTVSIPWSKRCVKAGG